MILKTYLSALFILAVNSTGILAQVYKAPAVGLKSHQTMEVLAIDRSTDKTVIRLSIENKIRGGTFCADRNIFIITPDGLRLKLQKATGIPHCPDSYKFRKEGEILEFILVFPALPPNTGWIDLVEECSQNCFSVYGILMNDAFSRRIDEAISYVNKGRTDTAIGMYMKLIEEAGPGEAGIAGSLYSDLISLLSGKGYPANAAEWYRKLAASSLPGKQKYIDNLNFRGIKY